MFHLLSQTRIYCPPTYNQFCHFHSQLSLAYRQNAWCCMSGWLTGCRLANCLLLCCHFLYFGLFLKLHDSPPEQNMSYLHIYTFPHHKQTEDKTPRYSTFIFNMLFLIRSGSYHRAVLSHIFHFYCLTSVWQDILAECLEWKQARGKAARRNLLLLTRDHPSELITFIDVKTVNICIQSGCYKLYWKELYLFLTQPTFFSHNFPWLSLMCKILQ